MAGSTLYTTPLYTTPPVDVALQILLKPTYHPRMKGEYLSRKKQQTRSLQIPLDRAHKCESAAKHGGQRGGGPDPLGKLCPQQRARRVCGPDTNCRARTEEIDHVFFGAPQAPAATEAITPRALAEPPAAAVGTVAAAAAAAATVSAPAPAPAEPPVESPTVAAIIVATAPADAFTATPPVLSPAATAPATVYNDTRGAGNTREQTLLHLSVITPCLSPGNDRIT